MNVSITSELVSDFLSYSCAIFNRALPDIVDGLKIAQRRVLLGMKDLDLSSGTRYIKVSRLDGTVLSKYHPHGSSSSVAIVMGQQSGMRFTLSDIHGNAGGSIQHGDSVGQMVSEDPPAAPRYLEIRSTEFSDNIYIDQIRPGTGVWRENYDGTCKEPVRFVPALPALLLTGSQGIASGYACNHIPWNLRDVINATIHLIKNKKPSDKSLLSKFTNPPEPAAGGRIVKNSGITDILLNGKGAVVAYGKWEFEDKLPWGKRSTRPALIVTRLANGSSEKFLDRVRDLADSDKLTGLLDAADHSSRDGIRIVLVMKKVEDRDAILSTLIHSNTGLKYVHNVNCTAVGVDGKPHTVGAKEAIMTWYTERISYVAEVNQYEVDKLTRELARLDAIVKILKDLDKFLKIVRTSKDKESAVTRVMRGWKLNQDVARYVIGIPVSTLINTESNKVREQHASVSQEIDTLKPLCHLGPELDSHICAQISSMRGLYDPARAEWMTETIDKAPVKTKPLTARDQIVIEGKSLGMTTRAVNKWITDNIGTGNLHESWGEYKKQHKHRVQMTTRAGRAERKQQLESMKSHALSQGMPKRGKYAWNAFIKTCCDKSIDEIRVKLNSWLKGLTNAKTNPDKTQPRPDKPGRKRSPKASKGKRSQGVVREKSSTGSRKTLTGNAPARSARRSSRSIPSGS